jgi:HK97 family phage major capsid protein
MRQLARVVKVDSAEFKQPHSTLGTGYSWVGESQSRPSTAAPGVNMVTIPTCEVYAQPAITQQLLDDAAFGLENWLINELGDAFGDAEADAFINGNGVARPRGLFTYDVVSTADATRANTVFQYVPTGGAGAFASSNPSDALISLVYAVKPQYRANASWLMSSEVLELVRKFKVASTNEYLWQPSNQAGQPATLLGFPVFESENVPAIAANSLSCAFGDFSRSYTITDRNTLMIRDNLTNKPFVNFYSTKRLGGGGGRDTRAVKFLKFAAS